MFLKIIWNANSLIDQFVGILEIPIIIKITIYSSINKNISEKTNYVEILGN